MSQSPRKSTAGSQSDILSGGDILIPLQQISAGASPGGQLVWVSGWLENLLGPRGDGRLRRSAGIAVACTEARVSLRALNLRARARVLQMACEGQAIASRLHATVASPASKSGAYTAGRIRVGSLSV